MFEDPAGPAADCTRAGRRLRILQGMDLSWIDALGLVLVGAFLILGFVRGLWWQVIRALGLGAAVLVARAGSPALADWVVHQWPSLSARSANGIAWVALFLLALSAATLLGIFGRKLLEAMQLGLVDRVGGALIGAATGFGLHVVVLVGVCQLGTEPFVARTLGGTASERIVDVVGAQFPVVLGKEAGAELDLLLQRNRLQAEAGEAREDGAAEEEVPAPVYLEDPDPEPPSGPGVK
jgi:uncharacterized membrane protein required for colicin V production